MRRLLSPRGVQLWPRSTEGAPCHPRAPNSSAARPNPWRAHLTLVVRPRAVRLQAAPPRPPRGFAGVYALLGRLWLPFDGSRAVCCWLWPRVEVCARRSVGSAERGVDVVNHATRRCHRIATAAATAPSHRQNVAAQSSMEMATASPNRTSARRTDTQVGSAVAAAVRTAVSHRSQKCARPMQATHDLGGRTAASDVLARVGGGGGSGGNVVTAACGVSDNVRGVLGRSPRSPRACLLARPKPTAHGTVAFGGGQWRLAVTASKSAVTLAGPRQLRASLFLFFPFLPIS